MVIFVTVLGLAGLIVVTVAAGLRAAMAGQDLISAGFSILGVGEVLVAAWYLDPEAR